MDQIAPTTWVGAITFILLGLFKVWLDVRAVNRATIEVKKTADRVLTLANGRMLTALMAIVKLSKTIADLTKEPVDIELAKFAETDLHNFIEGQERIRVK